MPMERLSATVKKEVYDFVLDQIKKGNFRNRAHVIEKALEEFMKKFQKKR